MTGSGHDALVEERACRILNDQDAVAAHADYVEAQLRHGKVRDLLAGLRALARAVVLATFSIPVDGYFLTPIPGTFAAEETGLIWEQ
jgi:hypothetical protein